MQSKNIDTRHDLMIWSPTPQFSTSDIFLWSIWINSQKQKRQENQSGSEFTEAKKQMKMYPLLTLILPTSQLYDHFWFPLLLAPKFYHQGSVLFLQWEALQPGREQIWTPSSFKELLVSFKIVDVLDEFFSFPNLSYLFFCCSSLRLSFKPSSNSPHFSWVMEPIYSFGSHQ